MTIAKKIVLTDVHLPVGKAVETYTYVFNLFEDEVADGSMMRYLKDTVNNTWNSKCNIMIQDKSGRAVSYRRLLRQKKGIDFQLGKLIRDLKNTH